MRRVLKNQSLPWGAWPPDGNKMAAGGRQVLFKVHFLSLQRPITSEADRICLHSSALYSAKPIGHLTFAQFIPDRFTHRCSAR